GCARGRNLQPMLALERMQAVAELTHDVMFREDNATGYSSEEIAALNFELMDVLGNLKLGSDEYMARAKAFHDEVAGL
ncbi:MAG: hypothetical protein ACJ8AW_27390, partial [Rhodopila sp.]